MFSGRFDEGPCSLFFLPIIYGELHMYVLQELDAGLVILPIFTGGHLRYCGRKYFFPPIDCNSKRHKFKTADRVKLKARKSTERSLFISIMTSRQELMLKPRTMLCKGSTKDNSWFRHAVSFSASLFHQFKSSSVILTIWNSCSPATLWCFITWSLYAQWDAHLQLVRMGFFFKSCKQRCAWNWLQTTDGKIIFRVNFASILGNRGNVAWKIREWRECLCSDAWLVSHIFQTSGDSLVTSKPPLQKIALTVLNGKSCIDWPLQSDSVWVCDCRNDTDWQLYHAEKFWHVAPCL